jgi:hypothetical protein
MKPFNVYKSKFYNNRFYFPLKMGQPEFSILWFWTVGGFWFKETSRLSDKDIDPKTCANELTEKSKQELIKVVFNDL